MTALFPSLWYSIKDVQHGNPQKFDVENGGNPWKNAWTANSRLDEWFYHSINDLPR